MFNLVLDPRLNRFIIIKVYYRLILVIPDLNNRISILSTRYLDDVMDFSKVGSLDILVR